MTHLVPNALEKLAHGWNTIPECERHAFFSVGVLCCNQNGKVVGDTYPAEPFDANFRELRYVHRIRGEKWIVGLTNILRRYPFPEIPGTYLPEGIVWFDIAKTFKTRWLNEALRIYYVDDPERGRQSARQAARGHHALGRWHYYIWLLNNNLGYFFYSPTPFLKAAVMLPIVSWYSGQSFRTALRSLEKPSARALVLLAFPLASPLYTADRNSYS